MANELQLIADMLKAINLKIEALPTALKLSAKQVFATELSAITSNAGLLTAGEFRVGNGNNPGSGFTGVRMAYPPIYDTTSADSYPFGSWNTDVLQVGISLTDGKLYAGTGVVVLDSDGISLYSGTADKYRIKFLTVNGYQVGSLYGYLGTNLGASTINIALSSQAGADGVDSSRIIMRSSIAGGAYEGYVKIDNGDIFIVSSSNVVNIGEGTAGIDYAITFDGETNDGIITWMEDEAHFKLNSAILVGGDTAGEASTVAITNVTSGVSTGAGSILMNGTTARDSTGWLKIMDGTTAKYIPFFTTITG